MASHMTLLVAGLLAGLSLGAPALAQGAGDHHGMGAGGAMPDRVRQMPGMPGMGSGQMPQGRMPAAPDMNRDMTTPDRRGPMPSMGSGVPGQSRLPKMPRMGPGMSSQGMSPGVMQLLPPGTM